MTDIWYKNLVNMTESAMSSYGMGSNMQKFVVSAVKEKIRRERNPKLYDVAELREENKTLRDALKGKETINHLLETSMSIISSDRDTLVDKVNMLEKKLHGQLMNIV